MPPPTERTATHSTEAPEPTRSAGTDLRSAILEQSRHLLIAHGYDALSMRKIAKRIGYSATAIYLHFDSKESLFHALIEQGMDRMSLALSEAASRSRASENPLRSLCRAYIDFGLENPEYYEVMFVLKPVLRHRYPADKYRRARRNLDIFAEALRAGGDPAIGSDSAALRIDATRVWAMLHGVVSLLIAKRIDSGLDPNDLIEAAIDGIVASAVQQSESTLP